MCDLDLDFDLDGERERARERGSAVVDFALVGSLVVLLMLGVLQLALGLFVRTTLIDAAAEGARLAALHDSSLEAGVKRTQELLALTLAPRYAEDVVAAHGEFDGVGTVEITVRAPLPLIGLLGPGGVVEVTGRAVQER